MNIINNVPRFNVFGVNANLGASTKTNFSYRNLGVDTFEKSTDSIKSVSFKGNSAYLQRADKAAELFKEHIMSEEFDIGKISEIVDECSNGTIKTEEFNRASCANALDATIGYIKAPMAIGADGQVVLLDKVLCIAPPRDDSFDEKVRVLRNTAHEFTHGLQFEDPQKSRTMLIQRYVKNHPVTNKKNLNTITQAPKVSTMLERLFVEPVVSVKQITNTPKPTGPVTVKQLDKMFKEYTGLNTEAFMRKTITEVLDMADKRTGGLDKNFVLSYLDSLAKMEKEAYEQDIKVAKKVTGIEGNADLDFVPLMYQQLSNVIQKMKK